MGANRSSKDVSHVASLGLNLDEQKAVDRFRKDVVEPSMTSLVILDFWAEWCGPCKALTPVLEKVAADYADKGVVLAKVNVDEEQFIASQFQVRSIPTVYAMFQGQPVADLTNARGESQLKQTLDQLLAQLPIGGAAGEARAEIAQFVAMGEQILGEGDAERAAGIFAQVVEMAPEEPAAHAGLIRALAQAGRTDEAQAALAGAEATPGVADNAALRALAAENPTNFEVRLAFAEAAFAAGDRDAAADELLAMIQADRDWNEGVARAKLVRIFEAVGLEDAWVVATRRRLSRLLFG